MNTNLLTIVRQIVATHGESILENPQRLKSFFSDLAKNEPKPLRVAFGRCIEAGAYAALKNAPDAGERASRKASIAQRLRDDMGLDAALCAEALDVLEAALFGGVSSPPAASPEYRQSAGQQAQTAYVPPPASASPPQYQPPMYTNVYVQQNQNAPQPPVKTGSLWTTVLVLNALGLNYVSRFLTGHTSTGILVLLLDIVSWATVSFGIGIAGIVASLIIWILDLLKICRKQWQMADGSYLVP
ncbi:MAG: hypothetical protein Ta2A_14220 [Treponemataceae bacterium]|nr:MAG: hypothetical protein Ta2A_14220 [Treponemataceae bacterium]